MKIQQFKYSHDNFGYLVYSDGCGIAIDMGDADALVAFAARNKIRITHVTNTHLHHDHTSGNTATLEKTGAPFLDCREFVQDQVIPVGSEGLRVLITPGHTLDSVCFDGGDFLVTGDTLFNGTVGNCFSGDLDAFYHSIKQIMAFPKQTLIYSGHDYVKESLTYAASIEGQTKEIQDYLAKYNPAWVVSTLGDELLVNPYLRFNDPGMLARLEKASLPMGSELERFKAVMEIF